MNLKQMKNPAKLLLVLFVAASVLSSCGVFGKKKDCYNGFEKNVGTAVKR